MIITEKIVILNLPKTGSSFVRIVIKNIFLKRNKNILAKSLHILGLKSKGYKEIMTEHPIIPNYKDQHGCYDQIPAKYKNNVILSVIRNPYSRLESIYRFKWWAHNPLLTKEELKRNFPNFPDLTFDQFLKLQDLTNEIMKEKYKICKDIKIGNQTIQFIRFFFKDHKKVLARLNNNYIISGAYKNDICNVTFIKNENLNEELVLFLSKNGFSNEELHLIFNHKKINVSSNITNQSIVNEKLLLKYINEKEWILFEILSHLGIYYKKEK